MLGRGKTRREEWSGWGKGYGGGGRTTEGEVKGGNTTQKRISRKENNVISA
jgi:hypothetical protein